MNKRPNHFQSGSAAHSRDQAFSLIELVVALSISAMLLITIGGAVTVASKSLPGKDDVNRQHSEATAAAATMASDLRYAISFFELTPTAITFTVADRDDDGHDETIRYQCTGTASKPMPLLRTVNGNTGTMLESAEGFNLEYGTYNVTEPGPLLIAEGSEQLLVDEASTTGNSDFQIRALTWVGSQFNLQLGNANTSWRLTRAKLMIENQGNSNGVMNIELRTADENGLPSGDIIDQVSFLESNASSVNLSEINFTNATDLSPDTTYCLVVTYESGNAPAGCIKVHSTSSGSPNTALVETFTGETGWQARATGDLVMELYGHVTGFSPTPATVSATRLRWVGITIEPVEVAQSHVTIQTQILSKPEVAP